jgi:AraC family transcriptional activator of pobA
MVSEEIITYEFKEGLANEFEIVDIPKLFKAHKDIMVKAHRTGFYHILWIKKGSCTHVVDFSPISLPENSLLFLNKDTIQIFDSELNFEAKAILFTQNFFSITNAAVTFLKENILFNDQFAANAIQLTAENSPPFEALFLLMEEEANKQKDAHQPKILRSLLYTFLQHAEREKRQRNFFEVKQSADRDYMVLFRDLLEVSFKNHKNVSFYASKLSLTEKRLNQAVSKILGKTVKQAIDERIMLEAKRLLAHTNENIKEVGFSLGFEEPTNFVKYFRKHNSGTPMEFRAELQGGKSGKYHK